MQPIVMNFCKMVNDTKSMSKTVSLLANHPKLLTCLAQFHDIYIQNGKPVIKYSHLQFPCSRETLVDNMLEDTEYLADGTSFYDSVDPMSPAYHDSLSVNPTSSAISISQSLIAKNQMTTSTISSDAVNPSTVFGTGLDKLMHVDSDVNSISNQSNSNSTSVSSMDAYAKSIFANYNPQVSLSIKKATNNLVKQAIDGNDIKHLKKHAKHHYKQQSAKDMEARFNSAFDNKSSNKSSTATLFSKSIAANSNQFSINPRQSSQNVQKDSLQSSGDSSSQSDNKAESNHGSNILNSQSKSTSNSLTNTQKQSLNGTSPFA